MVDSSASRNASIASIGPMLVTGFDGPMTTGPSVSAESAAGDGSASSAPLNSTPVTSGSPPRATQNS
ncbi:hypothetical protein A4G99_12640 [Haladaptatus sp. R4]|nr:hypothetical protein A4G99_12640 [Haladaptatus sp. R4]